MLSNNVMGLEVNVDLIPLISGIEDHGFNIGAFGFIPLVPRVNPDHICCHAGTSRKTYVLYAGMQYGPPKPLHEAEAEHHVLIGVDTDPVGEPSIAWLADVVEQKWDGMSRVYGGFDRTTVMLSDPTKLKAVVTEELEQAVYDRL